jgi:V/A-type H+-transporting ATPase subunit I
MTRLAVMAPKSLQVEVIEALHDARAAHIEEYGGEDDELDIGDPLPAGSTASQRLVRIRGLLRTLDLEDAEPARQLTRAEVLEGLDEALDEIEAEVDEVDERVTELERQRKDLRDRLETLEALDELPLRLDDYHGYASLEVFVGTAPEPLEAELAAEVDRFEYFASEGAHAVFVDADEAGAVREVLTREPFEELAVPEGEGTVASTLTDVRRKLDDLERALEDAEDAKRQLAREHETLLLCAEEELSITTEKAEAPLDFASTERTFVVDAWVPGDEVEALRRRLDEAAQGRIHLETLDEGDRDAHGRESEPPTRYDHPTGVKPFAFLQETFSTPSYDEVDPTLVLSLVFPLFLGFMIGDAGYGLLMVGLGFYLYRSFQDSEALNSLGFALLVSGVWAMIFGLFVFYDAFGIPYYEGAHPGWGDIIGFSYGHPVFSKLKAVDDLLALSLLAAFVHLFVGFTFAFANHLGHDLKHAAAQIGWVAVLTGFLFLTAIQGPQTRINDWVLGLAGGPTTLHSFYLVGGGVAVLVLTEGLMGLMETVSLLANMISYTRLAAIAVAKAGILEAFTEIFLLDMALAQGAGPLAIVAGVALFAFALVFMFALGLLSSGIQSIRLNYVEFFMKFFEGGGRRFDPFGRERRYTLEADDAEVRRQHG